MSYDIQLKIFKAIERINENLGVISKQLNEFRKELKDLIQHLTRMV